MISYLKKATKKVYVSGSPVIYNNSLLYLITKRKLCNVHVYNMTAALKAGHPVVTGLVTLNTDHTLCTEFSVLTVHPDRQNWLVFLVSPPSEACSRYSWLLFLNKALSHK